MTNPASAVVHYCLYARDTNAHEYEVVMTLAHAYPEQKFSLPVWIPGSYLIREFAKHVGNMQATDEAGNPVCVSQVNKHCWQLPHHACGKVQLRYRVYAFDASVRAAFLDSRRGFFNASSLLLQAVGFEMEKHALELDLPDSWQIASSMPWDVSQRSFVAASYEEFIDHPFTLGHLQFLTWQACGVTHQLVLPADLVVDAEKICLDAASICEQVIRFFGEPAPFASYLFHVQPSSAGYGGLEHRNSSALVCKYADLPVRGHSADEKGYRDLLGLICHEYFHAWFVKRLRPASFARYQLDQENYTHLLWVFEGLTSYFDDLLVYRAGLMSRADYLQILATNFNQLQATPGRLEESVASSSWNAWIKLYRPDENSINSSVSYYLKGSLLGLALDLTLRLHSQTCLDDVVRALWQRWQSTQLGLKEHELQTFIEQLSGAKLNEFFQGYVYGVEELPIPSLLESFAVQAQPQSIHSAQNRWQKLGLQVQKLGEEAWCTWRIKTVLKGSWAQAAGLCAGDQLIAIQDWRMNEFTLARTLAALTAGDCLQAYVLREDRFLQLQAQWQNTMPDSLSFVWSEADSEHAERGELWLSGKPLSPLK